LIADSSLEFTDAEIVVESITATCYPPLTLEVNIFKPNAGDLLPKTQYYTDLESKSGQILLSSPPLGIVGTYFPCLRQKFQAYIEDVVSGFAYTLQVAAAGNSTLSWKVFEAVHRFHQTKPV
jgi:hypothetical protein